MCIRDLASPIALLALVGCGAAESLPFPAALRVEAEALDFGVVPVGTERTEALTLHNDGDEPLVVDLEPGAGLDQAAFSASLDRRETPPGGRASLAVSFAPERPSELHGTVTLRSNDPRRPSLAIALAGAGARALLEVSPSPVEFGNVVVGTAERIPLSVRNVSDLPATVRVTLGSDVRRCGGMAPAEATFCLRPLGPLLEDGERFVLEPGASFPLEVEMSPAVAGVRSSGSFELSACPQPACTARVELSGVPVETGRRCSPLELDFGVVFPGTTRAETLRCENVANAMVTLTGWAIAPSSASAFTAQTSQPVALAAGEATSIEVRFAPTGVGTSTGTLRIRTGRPAPFDHLDVALVGSGGGPDIQLRPDELEFGEVSLNAPVRRRFVVDSVGYAPLTVSELQVDTAGTGWFRSPDATADVLDPGASKTVTVEVSARTEGEIRSAVRVVSDDADEGELTLSLSAVGRNLPPCRFEVASDLDLGRVLTTRAVTRSVLVRNVGSDLCLVAGARLLPGSDPAFSLVEGDVRSLQIPAGQAAAFPVRFAPSTTGRHTARLELMMSSPSSPFVEVELVAEAVEDRPLVVAPSAIDFGTVAASGCRSLSRTLRVYNPAGAEVRIDRIALTDDTSSEFQVPGAPTLPRSLAAGDRFEVQVALTPGSASVYAGAMEIEATVGADTVTYPVPLDARSLSDAVQVDEHVQQDGGPVDVLVVVDPSGSMGQELEALGAQAETLLRTADQRGIDYHVGVTSSVLGTIGGAENGSLFSSQPGTTYQSGPTGPEAYRIVTRRSRPDPAAALASNLSMRLLGGAAGQKEGLGSAQVALAPPVLFSDRNAGFVRRDAALSVVLVSDEPDQSADAATDYVDLLRAAKLPTDRNRVTVSAIAAPTPPGNCSGPGGSATASGRYQAVVEATGGSFHSICAADWEALVEDLARVVFGLRSSWFLDHPAEPGTIEVSVDGATVPARDESGQVNWTFDAGTQTVAFSPSAVPEPGATIRFAYRVDCR